MNLECLRINDTDRLGKITAKWALVIYADFLDRFMDEINFITEKKRRITQEMKKVKGRRSKFFSLTVIDKIEKNNIFMTKDFVIEMRKLGYHSPECYLTRYLKAGIIKRINHGLYKLSRKSY
ncbi:MAG: hypothetical protein AOA65_1519 [Candidatus Bathyarchaeota archaeon BA1]|nr:MAG: hypothetical protein AOA65_1519 [Candidatus Bathyarchaeota archaeon BA1]